MLLRDSTLIWVKAHPDEARWGLKNCAAVPEPLLVYLALHVYLYP